MKRCLSCNASFVTSVSNCPNCGFVPILINGFDSYAPEFAYDGGGFDSSYFSELACLEESNFWFRARNQLIIWALNMYHPKFENILEIGCGTGYVLSGVAKSFPDVSVHGSEIFVAGLEYAAEKQPNANFMQMDAREIPFVEEFDVVGAFDVLEHIKEDNRVLRQVFNTLKPNGFLLLTVPQHAWLWSSIDEYACHIRRYSEDELHKKIEAVGFRVIRSTSFVTTLLPLMMISRLIQKKVSNKKFDAMKELKISPWLNSLLYKFLYTEIAVIKIGYNFPIGGSRLVIAKKV